MLLAVCLMVPSITVQARTYVDNETPIDVQIACDKYGAQYNICPELLEAICYQESRFTETAVDGSGSCIGLMQIHKASHITRMKRLGVTDLTDIDSNVLVAADYLAELFDEYEDVGVVLTIYHGESNVDKAKQGQLSSYVESILENSERLERLHGKK